jgi:hypothetical protein
MNALKPSQGFSGINDMMKFRSVLVMALAAFICAGSGAQATSVQRGADIVDVVVTKQGDGLFRFDVTVHHEYETEDRYADRWEIIWEGGSVLGARELAHHHVGDMPFTRSLSDVRVPEGIDNVIVRAHVRDVGYGGKEMSVALPR